MEINTLDIQKTNEKELENKQNNFLESSLGKTISSAVDIGIRAIFPDFIEEQVINLKDNLLKYGFSEGIKTTIQDTISVGKSAIGLITGNFDNINQMQQAIKAGGLIDGISSLLDIAISNGSKNGIFNFSTANNLIKGKDILLDSVQKNIEKTFSKQLESVENLQSHIDNWKNYFENKDFEGMEREYEKIREKLKELLPIENTIKEARVIENLHTLIKNNGQDFNLTEEQKELATMLT